MTFDPNIQDPAHYKEEMKKSLIDKIFFVDKINVSMIVDFGCANGIMLDFLQGVFPEYEYIGYDISNDMIEAAKNINDIVTFTTDWSEVESRVKNTGGKKALVLSSVIHEVYSYMSVSDIEEFWQRIWNSGFDYIVIRDMMVERATSRASDPLMVARIKQIYDKRKLMQWETQWGGLHEQWSLVHFLLTYRYEVNWEREHKENYLPLNLEDLLSLIPSEYFPIYMDHYCLPFIKNKIREDFGIDLQDRTHIKLIVEKR